MTRLAVTVISSWLSCRSLNGADGHAVSMCEILSDTTYPCSASYGLASLLLSRNQPKNLGFNPCLLSLFTPQEGQLKVQREKVTIDTPELDPSLIFEQDPVQILDALLPLYMNSCLLRSLQEALASELAARMNAMNSATDNAKELKKVRWGGVGWFR